MEKKRCNIYLNDIRSWIEKYFINEKGFLTMKTETKLKKKDINFYLNIMNKTKYIDEKKKDIKIQERIFHIMKTDLSFPKCFCGNEILKFHNYSHGYNKCCSKECSYIQMSDNSKKTCLEKYGVENPIQCPEIYEKTKKTNLKRYGVENPSKNKEVIEKIRNIHNNKSDEEKKLIKEKSKKTCLERYGVENPFQSKEIQEKIKQVSLERYGVDHPFKNKEIQERYKQTCLERHGVEWYSQSDEFKNYTRLFYSNLSDEEKKLIKEKSKKTCLERYGVEYISQTEEWKKSVKQSFLQNYGVENCFQSEEIKEISKKTCLERYGVEYSSQCPEIYEKIKSGNKKSWHDYILPSGKIINVQGYEPMAFDILLEKYTEDDILYKKSDMPEFWYFWDKTGKKHRYYPDFYIPKDNLIIEVKSEYTYKVSLERNLLKELCVLGHGYDFNFMIINAKGEITNGY